MLTTQQGSLPPEEQVFSPVPLPTAVMLRRTRDPRRMDGWALVLVSRGLTPLTYAEEGLLELWVPQSQAGLASGELDAADAEEQQSKVVRQQPAFVARHAGLAGVLVAAALLGFFALTGTRTGGSSFFEVGASSAERVLQGEWWRAVTALTLHADAAHVVSNMGIGALVVGAVMRSEGIGWGGALVLASGTAGNLLNAWAHQSLHSSVGFSTAVFGAIGLLGGLAFVRGRAGARAAWTALGGTVAMLAMMGASERSDIFAHLFGALAGVLLGALAARVDLRPRRPLGQWLAGLSAAGVVVGAWLRAFV